MKPLQQKKPKRLYAAVAMLGGVVLLVFEVQRWSTSSPEKWFWALVAILMIALGLAGMFQRSESGETDG